MAFDKGYVELVIAELHDTYLATITRAADMGCFSFAYEENTDICMGVHFQCPFRLISPEKTIVLAARDIYEPCSAFKTNPDFNFFVGNWGDIGNTRFDEITDELLPRLSVNDFIVASIELTDFGDLKVAFANGYRIETFVNSSGNDECWRYLPRDKNNHHLVIAGIGIID